MTFPRPGVGIDFGTSNSTAAWFDGHTLHSVRRSGPAARADVGAIATAEAIATAISRTAATAAASGERCSVCFIWNS